MGIFSSTPKLSINQKACQKDYVERVIERIQWSHLKGEEKVKALIHRHQSEVINCMNPYQIAVNKFIKDESQKESLLLEFEYQILGHASDLIGCKREAVFDRLALEAQSYAVEAFTHFKFGMTVNEILKKHLGANPLGWRSFSYAFRKMVLEDLEFFKEQQDDYEKIHKKNEPAKPRRNVKEIITPGATDWIKSDKKTLGQTSTPKIVKTKKKSVEKKAVTKRAKKDFGDVTDILSYQKDLRNQRKLLENNKNAPDVPAYVLSIPHAGWTWFCNYHEASGLADDEEEALFMAGAHLYYNEVDEDKCEINLKEW